METADDALISREPSERCGQCGEPVPDGAAVCPACGALLAAYRTAPESPVVVEPDGSFSDGANEQPEPEERPAPPGVPDLENDLIEDLYQARDDEETAVQEVNEDFDAGFDGDQPREPPPTPASAPRVVEQAVSQSSAVSMKTASARPAEQVPRRAAGPARPRKPGYVARGTVEPVLLIGFTLLILAACLVGLASLLSVGGVAIAGFTFGAVGIISIVVAVLIALIRHEGNRR